MSLEGLFYVKDYRCSWDSFHVTIRTTNLPRFSDEESETESETVTSYLKEASCNCSFFSSYRLFCTHIFSVLNLF